jgi:hypothetical protein
MGFRLAPRVPVAPVADVVLVGVGIRVKLRWSINMSAMLLRDTPNTSTGWSYSRTRNGFDSLLVVQDVR